MLLRRRTESLQEQQQQRIVTFGYDKDPVLEERSYLIYMTGEDAEGENPETIATPIGTCSMMGVAMLNYFDQKVKGLEGEELDDAITLVARGIATLSGTTDIDEIEGIKGKIKDMGEDLLKSGILLIRIRPIDTNEIRAFHEAETEVLRSL